MSVFLPGSGLRLVVRRVAHGTELRHKEVVATMVGGRVLLDVGKLHKLGRRRKHSLSFICLKALEDNRDFPDVLQGAGRMRDQMSSY